MGLPKWLAKVDRIYRFKLIFLVQEHMSQVDGTRSTAFDPSFTQFSQIYE